MKNRVWLRGIVNLSARADEEHIRREIIELQEDTVVAALDILEREPGVLLADEVGMGKTFQTLAIIACLRHDNPEARVLVVTPTRELCEQWFWTAKRFGEHGFARLPAAALGTAKSLKELPALCRAHSVVFAPVSIFAGARAKDERGFLLALWAKVRRVPRAKLLTVKNAIASCGIDIGEPSQFLGQSVTALAKMPLGAAFKRGHTESRGFRGLDDLLAEGLEAFANRTQVRRALDRARFFAVGALLKPFDLLVVDEAHKFKDPWAVRSQAVGQVLFHNYRKAAFLTATPFQLGTDELKQVFRLFGGALSAKEDFAQDVEHLLSSVRAYKAAYDRFEAVWRLVSASQEEAFRAWSDKLAGAGERGPTVGKDDDPNVAFLAEQASLLLQLKRDHVEPAFRQWTLRSLKPNRRRRRELREWYLRADEAAVLPLILFDRLLFEEQKRGPKKSSSPPDLSISSSYRAAEQSQLLADRSSHASKYRRMVTRAIKSSGRPHPKIAAVVDEILDATLLGEKTLVFCERNATVRELQERLEHGWLKRQLAEWNEVCPGYTFEQVFGGDTSGKRVRGVREKIPPRFYRANDELSVALTESVPFALFATFGMRSELPRSFWEASTQVIDEANRLLSQCRVAAHSAIRIDYGLAGRCIDQAAVRWFMQRQKDVSRLAPGDHALIDEVLDKHYPDQGSSYLRNVNAGLAGDRLKVQWSISRPIFDTILSPRRPGIWIYYRRQLGRLSPLVRHMSIEAVRYFLTRREVPFLVEVLQRAGGPGATSADLRSAIEIWWQQETCIWRQKVGELLDYLPCLTESEQQAVLKDILRSPRVVQNSSTASARILRQNTFNAPFYPMVLIGNQTIQQGLDLHRQCRRVVHYDLRWNPSDLEQRIGRIERHGCLAERFDAERPEGKIHVIYPLLEQTADPSLYRDVRLRERWMDFLLGQPPTALQHEGNTEPVQPLPASLVEALKVRLGPPRCD